jgi:hypothetical protein
MGEQKKSNAHEKKWTEPQLTVLVRNTSDEAILLGCKRDSVITGPDGINAGCPKTGDGCPSCYSEEYS